MANKDHPNSIDIETSATVRTRTYRRHISIITAKLQPSGWMFLLIQAIQARAYFKPEPTSDIGVFRYAVSLLLTVEESLKFLNLPPAQVGRVEMRRVFSIFEDTLLAADLETSIKHRAGTYFRKYVLDLANNLSFAEPITRKTLRFKTRMYISSLPRSMLSDLPFYTGISEASRMPTAAMPHATIKDLYAKSLERVEIDLQRIIGACVEELKLWERTRQALVDLRGQEFTEDEVALCRAARTTGSKHSLTAFAKLPVERRLGLFCHAVWSDDLANTSAEDCSFPGVSQLLRQSLGLTDLQLVGLYPRHVLFLPYRLHSNELIAAFILLLCFTGWNAHALVNLTCQQIQGYDHAVHLRDGPLAIQGFKTKTDDHTPLVILDSTHPYAVYAINLLVWNNGQLREFGILDAEESRLWFSYSGIRGGPMTQQYIGFQNALSSFIKRHKLPRFSFDQIRPQYLMAEQLRSHNIDRVRDIAGHASISTTGHYQDQRLFRRLNSAINLEFQRRLEATVHFRLQEAGDGVSETIEAERVDTELIMPIGDGASCLNPETPPFSHYIRHEICSGDHCHSGNGCPNRKIIITCARIEELLRKRLYYIRNWARLRDENKDAFDLIHSERMLFTLGLYDFIKNSRYSHILVDLEKKLETE